MNWPLTGILAAIAIVVGIILLVVYAVRRGFVLGELPDTIETDEVPTEGPAPATEPPQQPRTLGAVGALLLVVGLALGVFTAVNGWSGSGTGASSADCAQSWNGCPQVTAPVASSTP
ncbi:MAG TPA: hypothetical protein VIH37_06650 [Candidatus Limnocylindrales bacterium]